MKNLILLEGRESSNELDFGRPDFPSVEAFTITEKEIFLILKDKTLWNFKPNISKVELIADLKEFIPLEFQVVGFNFHPELEAICLVSSNGEIVEFSISKNEGECVGIIEKGILCSSWSPDFEVIAFATANQTILLMTKDWEVLAETPFVKYKLGTRSKISWRGDGAYFVLSTGIEDNSNLFVWDRSGMLHSNCESVVGLTNSVSWRPSGDLIAAAEKISNNDKYQIVFYERNGLRHGEFVLRNENIKVLDLQFNPSSEILAILQEQNENKQIFLELWYRSNYHWYLKTTFNFGNNSIVGMNWNSEQFMCLNVLESRGKFYQFSFIWEYQISERLDVSNLSIVSVIDGTSMHVTPFRYSIIPPPMFASTFSFHERINCFHFGPKEQLAISFLDGTIQFYDTIKYECIISKKHPSLKAQLKNPLKTLPKQMLWVSENLLLLVSTLNWNEDLISQILLKFDETFKIAAIESIDSTVCEGKIWQINHNQITDSIFILLETGNIKKYFWKAETEKPHLTNFIKLPTPCVWIKSIYLMKQTVSSYGENFLTKTSKGEELIIGLDQRSKLYANEVLLSNECNSFTIKDNFLLWTTITNALYSVSLLGLTKSKEILERIQSIQGKKDLIREVEPGSVIVSAIPNDIKIILQMPRGNLETIYPRMLVLDGILNNLKKIQYKDAFRLMRQHRIDMNLFVDFNPNQFLNNIKEFVFQINNADHFNLFLSNLRNEDTTSSLFSDISLLPKPEEKNLQIFKDKLNIVSDALRKTLENTDRQKFLLPILTTYVKKIPQELEEVLKLIRSIKEQEIEIDVMLHPSPIKDISAEKALEYICWLVDVDKLFDIALGLYDFDLVLLVAQKSQKDPKEYLPFLTELQQMETFYQRYSIDMYLGRYKKALFNLTQAGDKYFEKCAELICDHEFYEDAIEIYMKKDSKQLTRIFDIYGNYLFKNGKFEDAALAFCSANESKKELESWIKCGNWKMAVICAKKLNYSQDQLYSLADIIQEQLKSLGQFKDAGEVVLKLKNDIDSALDIFINGWEWEEALYLCQFYGKNEKIDSSILPNLLEVYREKIQEIEENFLKFETMTNRLIIVKKNKLLLPKLLEGKEEDGENEETSSVISGMSGYSNSSTISLASASSSLQSGSSILSKGSKKPKQRHRKKKISGKEGSPYEEEYLIETLKGMIPSTEIINQINLMVKMLKYFKELEKAKSLEIIFEKLIQLCKSASPNLVVSPNNNNENNK